jgi:hypothetical protein
MAKLDIDHWFQLDEQALLSIRQAASETITQSEMMLRASCHRKWFYRYALKLERRGLVDQNLIYGSIMHRLLEELYKNKEEAYAHIPEEIPVEITDEMMAEITEDRIFTPQQLAEIELTKEKVLIAFNAYRRHYYKQDARLDIKQVERTIRFDYDDLQLCAKVDMVAKPNQRDGVLIWDFKTAGNVDALLLDSWTFRYQFVFYCWIYWKVTGIRPVGLMICGLKKTLLRPKIVNKMSGKTESRDEYLLRVKFDMVTNREKFFFRQRIPLPSGALERFEYEMLAPHVEAFKQLKKRTPITSTISALAMAQNTNQCHIYNSYCEYLSLCKDGTMALSEFDRRQDKHPEL